MSIPPSKGGESLLKRDLLHLLEAHSRELCAVVKQDGPLRRRKTESA